MNISNETMSMSHLSIIPSLSPGLPAGIYSLNEPSRLKSVFGVRRLLPQSLTAARRSFPVSVCIKVCVDAARSSLCLVFVDHK